MTKDGLEYISNFINSMICDENIIRIMKLNYSLKFCLEDFEKVELSEHTERYYCEYSDSRMIKAYEPFLNIIREMVQKYNLNVEKLLEEADIYSLQKSIFQSYIETGIVTREEKPILGERDYEKEKLIKGIVNLFIRLSEERPIFIILNGINQMCDSTLGVLSEFQKQKSYKLKILAITNEMGSIKGYMEERYNAFIQECDRLGMVSDWAFDEPFGEKNTESAFSLRNTEEELKNIRNMFYTFAIEQADYYMNMIYQKVELEKVKVSQDYRIDMFTLYIMINIFQENFSTALVLCERMNKVHATDKRERLKYQYHYYYYRATANMYIGNGEDARKDAVHCYELAMEMEDEYQLFKAMLLQNMAELSGWKDIWNCDKPVTVSEQLISFCHKYKYRNHLAHIFVYYFDNDSQLYITKEDVEQRIPNVTKGIWLAGKLGNEQFLIEAYRKSVMVASYNGYFETANYFYLKSIEIVKEMQDRFVEANIYNGLGYNCCSVDKYSEANRYYNKALLIFYEENNTDYIIETLYNMGLNAILAADYSHALEYLLAVINILKILKRNSLRVSNVSKIFGLTALAAFKQGNYYTAQLYTSKAGHFLENILGTKVEEFQNFLWSDDGFLYYHVSALLAERQEQYEEALACYDSAETHMKRSSGSMFFNYVHFAVDKAKLLQKLGRKEEAIEIWKEAREYFSQKGNFLRVRMFEDLIANGKWEQPPMPMLMTSITIDMLMDYVKTESIKWEAKSMRQRIRFFSTFQELVTHQYDSEQNAIDTLITNFKNNFNLDNILFINYENEDCEIMFNDLEYEISQEGAQKIVDYFKNNTNGFVLSKFSNNYKEYEQVLEIFDRSKFFSIVAAPIYRFEKLHSVFITLVKISESWNAVLEREVLDEDDLEMYMIVFRQVIDAIEKFRLNEQLKYQVVTDELTGLLNRKGYYEIIDAWFEKAAEEQKKIDAAIMYIDLDHFKYYNDTFGHHVGDALLKEFADIFKKACDGDGYVVRFGGDEFLILLDSADDKRIEAICEKIYCLIEKEHGFTDIVSNISKEDADIPLECQATCSIGVETGTNMTMAEEFSELRKHADAALYYGKKNGRGKMIRFSEMEGLMELS